MPEGCEVAVETKRLNLTVYGWKLTSFSFTGKGKKPSKDFSKFLDFISSGNHRVTSIDSHGKKTWIQVGRTWNIYFSYGLNGTFVLPEEVGDGGKGHDPKDFIVTMGFENDAGQKQRISFADTIGFCTIGFHENDALKVSIDKMGPDPMKTNLEKGHLLACFKKKKSSAGGKSIADFLCNQKNISGIGNMHASEILYRVGIHPFAIMNKIPEEYFDKIQDTAVASLREAFDARWNGKTPEFNVFQRNTDPKGNNVKRFKSENDIARYVAESVQTIGL